MSKTHQFRITVTTGKKSYAPGDPVPVGGKDGVGVDDIAAIEAIHGVWDGGEAPATAAGDDGVLRAAEKARQDAEGRVAALSAVIDAQQAVDAASAALSEKPEDIEVLTSLEAAEKALADAKAAAGLAGGK